jgi:serine/threonine protein phosphatase PrpC
VTHALGGNSEPKVDVLEIPIDQDDLYLLCSDGLNSMLTDDEIAAVLETGGSLDDTCQRLISEANERGGNDNISVVLIRPRSSTPADPS